ncbi:TetR/AcrR family transcriptional regulator, partial [Xanthomonas perforans]
VSKEGQQRLRSAQNSGVVRCDVCFDDLVVVAIATSLATEQHGAPKTRIAHLIGLFVDGIAAPRAASAA